MEWGQFQATLLLGLLLWEKTTEREQAPYIIDRILENHPVVFVAPTQPLSCLPLMVYYHDDLAALSDTLQTVPPEQKELLYCMAEAIAAALRRQLNPKTLISQLIAHHSTFSLVPALTETQTALERGYSLYQLQKRLLSLENPQTIWFYLGLFCFCATPTAFSLALGRASAIDESGLVLAWTGALIGAYGQYRYFPWSWMMKLESQAQYPYLLEKIEQLWQKWQGFREYTPDTPYLTPVAAPLTLQPRPTLQLVSHKEYLKFPRLGE